MQADILRDFDRFSTVLPAWTNLQPPSVHLTQTYDWNASCALSFRAGATLELISVTDEGKAIGFAPLVRRERHFVSRLELIGTAELHEPSGFLFESDAALRGVCREVVAAKSPAVLARVDRDGPLPSALVTAAQGHGRVVEINSAAAPYLDLASGWEGIKSGLSPRRRHDLRRARRLLEREGMVSIEITHPGGAAVSELLEAAFDVEARSWKRRHGSALRVKPSLAAFYRDYAHRIAQSGQLVMCFLAVAGNPVAMQIGVEHARTFWLLKIGYDERWAKASPGLQLLAESLRWACERGLATYEFLGSDEPWLRLWQPQLHRCCTLVYYPYSASGARALGADVARSICKRLRRKASAAARCRPGNERKNCG